MKYRAEISLTPKIKRTESFDVTVDKDIETTLYDEVVDKIYETMDVLYPNDAFPKADIYRIWIYDEGTEYPVVPESDKFSIKKLEKSKKYKKFLVLPEARYSITDECRLWLEMKEQGLVDKDAPYDYDKYHAIVEKMRKSGEDTEKDGR